MAVVLPAAECQAPPILSSAESREVRLTKACYQVLWMLLCPGPSTRGSRPRIPPPSTPLLPSIFLQNAEETRTKETILLNAAPRGLISSLKVPQDCLILRRCSKGLSSTLGKGCTVLPPPHCKQTDSTLFARTPCCAVPPTWGAIG